MFLSSRTGPEYMAADYLVIGEGEQSFCELVKAFFSGSSLDLLPGVPVRVRRIEGQPSAEVRFEAMTEGAEP
jgi:radical SAM superfamily enzyme YgiQ (UPF0313 family)